MTELTPEQNAMLERLMKKHFEFYFGPRHLAMARELLLAVQERDARAIESCPGHADPATARKWYAEIIREQTYADLFLKEGDDS